MKPSQPSGPVQSRVWYAHTLVVPEKRESKVNESAVAAAARLALQSAPPVTSGFRRPRRSRGLFELGLLGTTAVLLFLVWRQYAGDLPATNDPAAVAVTDVSEGVSAADAEAVEQVATDVTDEAISPAVDATVRALQESPPDKEPRVAGFTATNADYATAATSDRTANLPASEFALAPDGRDEVVGELAPSGSGTEIDAIEVDEGDTLPRSEAGSARSQSVESNDRSRPASTTSKAVSQTKPRKTTSVSSKKSAQVTDFGDCAMPSWAWRVFGFTEEKRKRPC